MIKLVSELDHPPVVGKFYLVYCGFQMNTATWVPLIGPAHEDHEIGVDRVHYHIDVRFLPLTKDKRPKANVQHAMGSIPYPESFSIFGLRRRKCVREMPIMPRVRQFDKLEARYMGHKARCGKCPHRGMPLGSLARDGSGEVICNGHGLRIRMSGAEGEVIKR